MGVPQRGEVGCAAEKLKAALTARLQLGSGDELNTGLFQAIGLVNGFLFSQCEDEQAFSQLKARVKDTMLKKSSPTQTTRKQPPLAATAPTSHLRTHSSVPTQSATHFHKRGSPLHMINSSAGPRAQTTLPGSRSSVLTEQPQQQQQQPPQQQQKTFLKQSRNPLRQKQLRKQRQRDAVLRGIMPTSTLGHGQEAPTIQEHLSPAQIETELNRMYAYGTRQSGMDWTMPPALIASKAFAMNANNDMGNMIKLQDEMARKAEAKRKADIKKKQQETMRQCDAQMAHVIAQRNEEIKRKRELCTWMDDQIAASKDQDAKEKREKEKQQAALTALFTSQLKEREDLQKKEDLQLKRETMLERMHLAALEKQDKENRERQAALNREKTEATKKQLDEALRRQAQERAREIEEERKATVDFMKEMDRQEYARLSFFKGRQEKLKALFERGGGNALAASLEEKARKDEQDMIRAQALHEAQEQEKERLSRLRRADMDRERRDKIAQQLAEKDAAAKAEANEMRRLKERLDAEQAAEKEAAQAAKAALRERQAREREALKAAVVEENMRKFAQHNEPMSERERLVHKKVIDMQEGGFLGKLGGWGDQKNFQGVS